MFVLELSEGELSSLKEVVEMHNFPCEDCSPDLDCGVYQRDKCIAKKHGRNT